MTAPRLASPADTAKHGEYDPGRPPRIRFTGRITPEPGRYHVYGGWFCPYSHRVAIARELAGLRDAVSMSYVDNRRDGRGWAFRAEHGPDPVNGFALLREAYEATEPGFDGHVSVPTLWDRSSARVVSNDYRGIEEDLAGPALMHPAVEGLHVWLAPVLEGGLDRDELLETYEQLDARLSRARFLAGDTLTLADVRLWVFLVRYDAGPNAGRSVNPGLHVFPHLWSYARHLYRIPAFRTTTDFASFTRPGTRLPDWN